MHVEQSPFALNDLGFRLGPMTDGIGIFPPGILFCEVSRNSRPDENMMLNIFWHRVFMLKPFIATWEIT
jgi:hypothetical protein